MADSRQLKTAISRWAREVHSQALDEMVPRIRPYAPEVTGELRRSIRRDYAVSVGTATKVSGRIVATAPQAKYTDQGTKPHVIIPRRVGGVLVFQAGGGTVFTRKVNHPGNAAKPWWKRSLDATWGPCLRLAAIRKSLR